MAQNLDLLVFDAPSITCSGRESDWFVGSNREFGNGKHNQACLLLFVVLLRPKQATKLISFSSTSIKLSTKFKVAKMAGRKAREYGGQRATVDRSTVDDDDSDR